MRTPRLKITEKNYDSIKKVADVLPKHAKGNDSVREALNISAGTWFYLRKSKSFTEMKDLQKHHNDARLVSQDGEIKPRPSLLLVPEAPSTMQSTEMVGIMMELHKINISLVRLCEAWESTPNKKGWLK